MKMIWWWTYFSNKYTGVCNAHVLQVNQLIGFLGSGLINVKYSYQLYSLMKIVDDVKTCSSLSLNMHLCKFSAYCFK